MSEAGIPAAPLTLEGSSVLHQMFRIRWSAWRRASGQEILDEAIPALEAMGPRTALFGLLGHKGDLLFLHFRDSFEELHQAELALARLRLADYLEATTSYLSVVELGLYESSVKLYQGLRDLGVEPLSEEWERACEAMLAQQAKAMHPRLYPEIPPRRYLCFYPMDKKRGESRNWYELPIQDRQGLMHEHGLIGRRYAGSVKQIISGSIGFDDWEWGVDLFADDPLVFKKLIYEMRFDQASAAYALFGKFYLGLRYSVSDLGALLSGTPSP
ncbi:MAG: heme-dependent peroxidase [Acidobacteria bacterium]|nr:heme-dependent peroxidase [Acidobacteriota bacterium]